MGKFFKSITSDGFTKEAKRRTIIRNIIKGTLRKIDPVKQKVKGSTIQKGVVERKVVEPLVNKALSTRPGQAIRKGFHWIDDPKKFKTTNRKSDFYVKPSNRKLVYRSGKVLGAPIRHPIRTGLGVGTYSYLKDQAADQEWRDKAFAFYDRKGSDLEGATWSKVKGENYMQPNANMFNTHNGTAFTQDEINRGMRTQFAGSNLVTLENSGFTYDDLGLPSDSLGNKWPHDNVAILKSNYDAMMNNNPGIFNYKHQNQYFNSEFNVDRVREDYKNIRNADDPPNEKTFKYKAIDRK